MRGQVGFWGSNDRGGLAVGFDPDMVSWLERQGTDRRVFVSVTKERRVICLPDAEGGRVAYCGADDHASAYRYVSALAPVSLFMDVQLPLFELTFVDFEVEEGCISGQLPELDHELAWPRLRADCQSYDAVEEAKRALVARLTSLMSVGQRNFTGLQKPPQSLVSLLPKGYWAEALREAQRASGRLTDEERWNDAVGA